MSDQSKIEWCDSTFNPWIGCTKVSAGCDHCYAEADFDLRKHRVKWGAGNPRSRTSTANWKKPLQWDRQHAEFFAQHGRRRRVFCASLADVFDNEVPDHWRAELFALIANTPNLDWLLLTKRVGNVANMLVQPGMQKCGLPPKARIGITVVNQVEADRDIPKLMRLGVPNFLSIEPLLGPIDLLMTNGLVHGCDAADYKPDWVIVGGESGPHARPMRADWARSIRDQCAAAGVPMLFKQWGEWLPDCQNSAMSGPTAPTGAIKVGKKAAGRLLDGVTHDGYPASCS